MWHIDVGGPMMVDPVVHLCGQPPCEGGGQCTCCESVTVESYVMGISGISQAMRLGSVETCPKCANHPKLPLLLLNLEIE